MLEVSHAPSQGIPPVKPGGRCGYQVQQVIETHLPHLTQSQLTGLAWWVCGTILAGSACQNAVASALSTRGNWNNLRQYLREWLYDGGDRARPCKAELDVSLCFAPLLRWVLAWWCSGRLVGRLQSRSRNLHVGIQEPALSLASLMPSGLSTLQCRRRRTSQSS